MSDADYFKTSVVVLGERQVDEFQALCALLGRRPHQLAADMVLAEIRRYRRRKNIAETVALLANARREYREQRQAEAAAKNNCIDIAEYLRTRA